jgi:hypothetical protein
MSDDDDEPRCEISGKCEPHPEESHKRIACCRWCGGERIRDYPFKGNWGQLTVGQRLALDLLS